jgi:SNF2 family DNA or RNA helicase
MALTPTQTATETQKKLTQKLASFDSYIAGAGLDSKDYQRDGVEWILSNELRENPVMGVRGGLVADEMGLGKTILMIGTLISNFQKRTLIVVPLALMDQWYSEIYRTTGHKALIYHGSSKHDIEFVDLEKAPIVITTYGQIKCRKDPRDKTLLHQLHWNRVLFDEAHHLRNSQTQNWIGSNRLSASIRWLITGTPIQNRKTDFYSLCAIMGYEQEFYMDDDNLMTIVRSSILKRKKDEVGIKLPDIRTTNVNVSWGNKSERYLAEDIHNMLTFSDVNTERGVNSAVAAMGNEYLPLLIRARQACIYPKLMGSALAKFKELDLVGDSENEEVDIDDAITHSSKIDAVVNKIKERKDNGRAKLVFCHYRGEIDVIASRLQLANMDVQKFDGRTSHSERAEILTTPCDVLILQIMTGCEGLNLQHFKEIYFVSPHWNPAVEDQAVARCHRIGQMDDVDIFRFQMDSFDDDGTTKTLDNYSASIQDAKRELYTFIDGE